MPRDSSDKETFNSITLNDAMAEDRQEVIAPNHDPISSKPK